jgi:hypothetical protein
MTKRYVSAVFRVVAITPAIETASAESLPAQTPAPQSQAGATTHASGQGAVSADRSGAKVQGSVKSSAAAHGGDNRATLAGDSPVNVVLT